MFGPFFREGRRPTGKNCHIQTVHYFHIGWHRFSTISGNTTTTSGGGGVWILGGTLSIMGSTISENTSSFYAGGVLLNNSTATIRHSTIANNTSAQSGGGIDIFYSGSATLDHTIVANNTSRTGGPDIRGSVTANWSLIEDTTGATVSGANNVTGSDPLLDVLTNNGGPTETHALLPGSPALDTGDPAAVAGVGNVPLFDQRGTGFDRVKFGRIDIGAFELEIQPPVFTSPTTANVAENTTVVHALTATDADVPAQTITFSIAGSGADNTLFELVGRELRFVTAPDFENPTAAGGGNDYVVSVLADDGNGGTTPQTIIVTVDPLNDNAPVLAVIGNRSIDELTELTFTAIATDADLPANNLIFSLDVGAPTGASIDSNTGVFTWTPTEAQEPGTFNVTVRVTDDGTSPLDDSETITINVAVADGDGVSGSVEDGAPNSGDGNNDGIQDSQQANVASLPNANDQTYVTLVSSDGTDLNVVSAITNPSPGDVPEGVEFPVGFLEYEVNNVAVGGSATVTIFLPDNTSINTFFKYGPEPGDTTDHWYEFLYDGGTGAEFFDDDADGGTDRIVLHYIDGQRGDDDLLANGVIVDPGAAAFQPNRPPTILPQSFDVAENETSVGSVVAADFDLPGDTLSFNLTGNGADHAMFSITDDGVLSFKAASDFETPLDSDGDNLYEVEVRVQDAAGESATATVSVTVQNQASITGSVFVDSDQDGLYDANEMGIDGVLLELLDEFGSTVVDGLGNDVTALTSDGGFYLFEDLDPNTYQVREVQPTGVDDGAEQLGSLGGAIVANDTMQLTLQRTDALDYVFAEIGLSVSSGDTATIGFWQNKHGQSLIAQGGTVLVDWLSANFNNIFGDSLLAASGQDVADFYRNELFRQKGKKSAGPAKVDAQFMAVAFATFFTNRNLAGLLAADFGFNVTDTGIGTKLVNVGTSGAAFGNDVEDHSSLTIMQLLRATNALTDMPDGQSGFAYIYDMNGDGIIDPEEAQLRSMANQIYSDINEQGDF